jgi:RNA polymerase sigma factor (sigma-70 family)
LSDQELILLLKKGDGQAFKTLVETWQDMVFNTILGMVQDEQEAEDLSQEVFVQIFQSIKQFRGDSKLSTWMYRIAVTKSLDWTRKKKAKKRINLMKSLIGFGDKEPQPIEFMHPGIVMENKESARELFKAMQLLPENQRVALTLIKVEGLSYEEVAAVLGLTIKAVEALMHRAKENLRKLLKDYYLKT